MEFIKTIISSRRKMLNMTQKELADKLSVSDKLVSKWEHGGSYPDLSIIDNLAKHLEIDVLDLLGYTNYNVKGDDDPNCNRQFDELSRKQGALYSIISSISSSFASMTVNNYDETINHALKTLGEFVKADRVYIFAYDFDKGITYNTYEWCSSGILPVIDDLQDVPLDAVPDWVNTHSKGETLYISNVLELKKDDPLRDILEPQGIKSLLTIPMFSENKLTGFLGFDSVKEFRHYNDFERSALFEFSYILISAMMRIALEKDFENENLKTQYILRSSNIAAWEWHIDTNELIVNDVWAELLGYTKEELEPFSLETWTSKTNPLDLEIAKSLLDKVLNKEIPEYNCEIRLIHKDGHEIWVRDTGKVITWDGDKPLVMIGTYIDISEIKRREEFNRVIKHTIDFAPISILIADRHMKTEFVNKGFEIMTGLNSKDIIGKSPDKILKSPFKDDDYYVNIRNHVQNGETFSDVIKSMRANGEVYWQSMEIKPITNEDNEIINYITITHDVSKDINRENENKIYKEKLEDELRLKHQELDEVYRASVYSLAKLTESRDYNTGSHTLRVQHLCKLLATELQTKPHFSDEINPSFINHIFNASALHDIGKIKVPDAILLKPGALTDEERKIMMQHVKYGSDTLLELVRQFPSNPIISMAVNIAKYHHEKWNGTGYLEGLSGLQIPLSARIMTIVDVYDALRSERPYKPAFSHKKACDIIVSESGTSFDPAIVEVFMQIHAQVDMIYQSLIN